MSTLGVFLEQVVKNAMILLDDVVVLAKPALSRIGDAATAAKMAATSAADDTLPLTKAAMKKASAVVVDDTAVSSDQLNEASIAQHREYAVWRKIVTGSLVNKVIIGLIILLTGAVAPVIPQIMLAFGAAYLAYEGTHKLIEYGHFIQEGVRSLRGRPAKAQPPMVAEEKKSAMPQFKMPAFIERFLGQEPKERAILIDLILLDAILSTEILLVANGTLGEVDVMMQVFALAIVSVATTLGVYGIVLLIIRADNVAGYFADPSSRLSLPSLAKGIHVILPYVLKVIGVIGTAAMLGVAGEVTAHLLPSAIQAVGSEHLAQGAHHAFEAFGQALSFLPFGAEMLSRMTTGFMAGLLLTSVHVLFNRLRH